MPEVESDTSKASQEAECSFKLDEFSTEIWDIGIRCEVIGMDKSLFVWIDKAGEDRLLDLSLAMKLPSNNQIVGSKVLGALESEISTSMARRFSERLNVPVWLSFNLEPERLEFVVAVENWLKQELDKRRDTLLSS